MVENINRLLAQSIGTLNAVLAVVFLLGGLSAGIAATTVLGPFGQIGGVIASAPGRPRHRPRRRPQPCGP